MRKKINPKIKLLYIKKYKGWTWEKTARHFGVSSRFLHYFLKGERKSKPLEKKINRSFGQMFRKRYFLRVDEYNGYLFGKIIILRTNKYVGYIADRTVAYMFMKAKNKEQMMDFFDSFDLKNKEDVFEQIMRL